MVAALSLKDNPTQEQKKLYKFFNSRHSHDADDIYSRGMVRMVGTGNRGKLVDWYLLSVGLQGSYILTPDPDRLVNRQLSRLFSCIKTIIQLL